MSKIENSFKQIIDNTKKQTSPNESSKTEQEVLEKWPIRFFMLITGMMLPLFALFLMFYEIVLIFYDIFHAKGFVLEPEKIFHALILSTTSVAFMGMHRAVHKLIPTKSHRSLENGDIAFFFTLMANALLLAGLILLYDKYYKKPEIYRHSNCDNAWNINNSDVFPR